MPTATAATRKKPAKLAAKPVVVGNLRGQMLTGQALLNDMGAYRKKVASTPKSARAFLTRLGVMSPSGKVKKLIRG